jgi:hypothetical protein
MQYDPSIIYGSNDLPSPPNSFPVTDAQILWFRTNLNVPSDYISVRIKYGGATFIRPDRLDLIQNYVNESSVDGYWYYQNTTADVTVGTTTTSRPDYWAFIPYNGLPTPEQPPVQSTPTNTAPDSSVTPPVVSVPPALTSPNAPPVNIPSTAPSIGPSTKQVVINLNVVGQTATNTENRAKTIDEMYSYTTNLPSELVYNVGRPFSETYQLLIRNNSTTNTLKVTATGPDFLEGDIPTTVHIEPQITWELKIRPAMTGLEKSVVAGERYVESLIILNVVPLDVTGPVLINRSLPPLSF